MSIDKQTPYGGINISIQAIGSVAGNAAIDCYGVLGLAQRSSSVIDNLLIKKEYYKGVIPKKLKNGYAVDLYIVVAYGVKITEIVTEVQKKVKYVLEKTFDIKFKAINVYVQGIKVL
ncbi:MAG: Asp23/Gls24 family envelope stress response protein [Erysipelotrichales bacterium]|nr:Asp23/Gls24 family envelope stress response protein [Erysipelotrichales bacterium]